MTLEVVRSSIVVASFEIDENTLFQRELMGMDKIVSAFYVSQAIDFRVNDYVVYDGNNYYIKEVPEAQKIDSKSFRYRVDFYGESYNLYNKIMMHLERTSFSYTGTPLDLLTLLVDNIQTLDAAWTIGDCALLEEIKTLTFSEQSCRTALTQIAEAWGLEYTFDGKDIYLLEAVGETKDLSFQYGRNKGLYTLIRKPVDEPFATRWYGYGGQKNVPSTYRSGLGRITFDSSPYDQNVATYGIKEGSVTFPEVFPSFTGIAATVPTDNSITCPEIDFDINDLAVTDGGAKIVFKTGDLGGNEFVITFYDHATKTIQFGVVQDESGYVLPNAVVKPAIGDKFTLTGIEMPSTYIDAAEAEVEARTVAWAAKNSRPKVAYDLDIDEKFIKAFELTGTILPGDRVTVVDTDLNVNEALRIQSVEWPLVNENAIKAVISEAVQYTDRERIVKDIRDNEKEIDLTQAAALYARQVADEIANAAIIQQFKRTFVGDRAVLSGAFVAGNPEDGEVAGINGAGTDLTEVRFWAGSAYADRATAPFRVLQNGSAYATALEVLNGCKIGVFVIDGGYLKTTDYDGGSGVGLLVSDDGMVSRNGEATGLPATAGVIIKGSFYGQTDQAGEPAPSVLPSPISAGVVGLRLDDLDTDAVDNIRYCLGVYGGFFNSIKNVGAKFERTRYGSAAAANELIKYTDMFVILNGACTGALLPEEPDHGMTVEIKNGTAGNLPITRQGADVIVDDTNASVNFVTVNAGKTKKLRYVSPGSWFDIVG